MTSGKAFPLLALALLAFPAQAVQWHALKRDNEALLSIDTESIKRAGDEASLDYMVDFRRAQGDPRDGTPYRSIVVKAKLRCKPKAISLLHTDAYALYGAKGIIIAKTKSTPEEMAFRPLEVGSSDEDLWKYVCEGKSPPTLDAPKPAAPKKDAPKKDAPKK